MPAFIAIQYDEDPLIYRGIILRMDGAPVKEEVFMTGNPTVDYLTAGFVAYKRLGPDAVIMHSSTLDHFVMDGGVLNTEDPSQAEIDKATVCAREYLGLPAEMPTPPTDTYDAEARDRCPAAQTDRRGKNLSDDTVADKHHPRATSVFEADDLGFVTLRVRCIRCKRVGFLDIDLKNDLDGISWDKPPVGKRTGKRSSRRTEA